MAVSSRKLAVKGVPVLVPLGSHAGKPSLPLGRPFTLVGSRHRAHLHLLSRTVSKSHAAIISTEGGLYIRDLASRERVFVNNKKVQEADLKDGDILRIGSFNFKYTDPQAKTRPKDVHRAPAGSLHVDGSQIPLPLESRTLVIGRRPTVDVPLMELSASTIHAIIFEINGKRYIRDLNSRTGTFVNGALIHQGVLNDGDTIKVGDTQMRYAQEEAAPAEVPELESLGDVEEMTEAGPVAEPQPIPVRPPRASDETAPIPLAGEEPPEEAAQEAPPSVLSPQSSVLDQEDRHLLVSSDLHQEKLSGSGSFADVAADAEEGEGEEAHAPLDLDWWPEQSAAPATPAPAKEPEPQPAAALEPAAPDDLIPLAGEEEPHEPTPPPLSAPIAGDAHVVTSSGAIPLAGEVMSAASQAIPLEPAPPPVPLEQEEIAAAPAPEPLAEEPIAAEPGPVPLEDEFAAAEPEPETHALENEAQPEPVELRSSFGQPQGLADAPEEQTHESPGEFEVQATHAEAELPHSATHISESAAPLTPAEVELAGDAAGDEDFADHAEQDQTTPPIELAPETIAEEPVAPEPLPLELANELVPAPDPQEVQDHLAGEVPPGATVAPEVIEEPADVEAHAEAQTPEPVTEVSLEQTPPIESHELEEWPAADEVDEASAELLPVAEPTPQSAQALEESIEPIAVGEADEDVAPTAEDDVTADLSDTTFGKAVEEFSGEEIGPLVEEVPAETEVTATAPVDVTEPQVQTSVASDEDAVESPADVPAVTASEDAVTEHAAKAQPLSDDAAADLLNAEPELIPLPDFSDLLDEDELTGDPMVDNAAAFLAHEAETNAPAPVADADAPAIAHVEGIEPSGATAEHLDTAHADEAAPPMHEQESVLTAPSSLLPEEPVSAAPTEQEVPTAMLPDEEREFTAHAGDVGADEKRIPAPLIEPAADEIALTAPQDVAQAVQQELDAPADEIAIEVVPPAQSMPPVETSIAAAEVAAADNVQAPALDELQEAAGESAASITEPGAPVTEPAAPVAQRNEPVAEPSAPVARTPAPAAQAPVPSSDQAPPEPGLPRGSVQDLLAGMTRDAGSYLGGLPLAIAPVVLPGVAPVTIKVKQDPPAVAPPPIPAPIGRVSDRLPPAPAVKAPTIEDKAPPARLEPPAQPRAAPTPQAKAPEKHADLPPVDLDELPELFDDGAALDAIPDDLDAITDETDVLKPAPAPPPHAQQAAPPRAPQATPPRVAPVARAPQTPAPPTRAAQAPPRAPAGPSVKGAVKPPKFLSPPAKKVTSPFDGLDVDDDEMDDIITSLPPEPDSEGVPTNAFDGLAADDGPGVDAFSLLPLPTTDPLLSGGRVDAASPAEMQGTGLAPADPLATPATAPTRPAHGNAPARPPQPPAPRAPQGGPPRAAQPSKRPAQHPSALDDIQPLPQRQGPPPPPPEKKRKKWKFFGVLFLLLSLAGAAGAWLQWPYLWQADGSLQFAGLEKQSAPRQRGFLVARGEELLSADVVAHAAQLYRDHAPPSDTSSIDAHFVESLVRNAKYDGNSISLEHMGRDPQVEKTKLWAILTALYEANRYRITDAESHAARLKQASATLDADKAEMQAIKDRQAKSGDRAKAQQAVRTAEQTLAGKQAAVDQITKQILTLQSQKSGEPTSHPAADVVADPQLTEFNQKIDRLEAKLAVVPTGENASPIDITKNVLTEYQQQIQLAQEAHGADSPLASYLSKAAKAHDTMLHAVAAFDERQRMQALVASKEPQNKQLAQTLAQQAAQGGAEMTQQIQSAVDEVQHAATTGTLTDADRTVFQGISRKLLLIQAAAEQLADSYNPATKDITAQAKQWQTDRDALVAQREERRRQIAMQAAAADAAALVQSSEDQARLARIGIAQHDLADATKSRDLAEADLKFAQTKLAEFSGAQEDLAADNLRLTQLNAETQQLEAEVARAASAEPPVTPVPLASAEQAIALHQLDPSVRVSAAAGIALLGFVLFLVLWRMGGPPRNLRSFVRTLGEEPLPQLPNHGAPVF